MGKIYLAVGDIHGSVEALKTTLELADKYNADKIILLGDIFGANASEMVEMLNPYASKLDIVKGNNDWYFEPENAKFEIYKELYENINGRLTYICHGHKLNDMNLAGYGAKIILQGHLHRPMITLEQGVIRICPGSISVPRYYVKTFSLFDDEKIQILGTNGAVIKEFFY